MRYMNISQMAAAFLLSRDTIRQRLRRAGLKPARFEGRIGKYDMSKAGPALFAGEDRR